MPQVKQIQLLGPRSASLPSLFPFQSRERFDQMQIEATAEPQVCQIDNVQQTTSPTDGVRGKPLASEEDDVQIIFCAPRRRKKRRRRLESHYSASPVNQDHVALAGPPGPKIHHVLPQEPRRRSIGVIQRLELCQIGEEKSPSVRAGSLPSMSYGADSVPRIQYPWFAEPTYYGMPASQFPSLKDSASWSDQSLPTLQTRPLPSIPWKPIHVEGQNPMKRKHDDGLHETSVGPSRSRQSVQMSPRTTPASETFPSFSPPLTNSYPWGTYAPDEYFPASPNCPGNAWDAFDRTGHYNHEPILSRDISLPSELPSPDTAIAAKPPSYRSSVSNMFGGRRETGAWQQNVEPLKAAFSSSSDPSSNIECPHLPGGGEQLRRHVHSPNPHSNPHALPPPSAMIALSNMNNPHALQLGAHPWSRRQETPVHASTASVPPRNNTRFAKSYDMLRKPSLYSIPPWPNPLDPAKSSAPVTTAQAHTKSQDTNANGSSGSNRGVNQARVNHDKPSLHLPNAVVAQRTEFESRQEATGVTPAKAATAVSSATQVPCSSNAPTFQIPKVRLGRKHSPNLIVDVAETCQELFPFAEVAERHEVPIQKVFDTFSAIIQLPLLRNADDRRRHGSLGKRRMKEYRDAKKAMEKAQEAERKAHMKEIRIRVEDAARGGEARNQPLLKSAVLNNARDFHGAS